MSKKFGLGKGLSALIPEEEETLEENNINVIPINLIRANDKQPRKKFDEEKIAELANSIKEHGVIQPVVLKKDDDFYTIIAGERRWRASKFAGLTEIPAVVLDVTDKQILEISLIENIQREDLNPIEEAFAFKRLIEDFSITQEELGMRIGKSRAAISNCMRLLQLDNRVQEYIIEGVISEGHGRAILSLSDKEVQYSLAQKVIDESLSVRETEKTIRELLSDKDTERSKEPKKLNINPFYIDIKYRLENLFGTKVNLNSKKNKGKIEIEYYSEEDLQRIIEILKL